MANAARGEVALTLGGQTYVLCPTFGAVCEIEDALQANLFDLGRKLELGEITARELTAFAHACLTCSGYAMERERLGEMIVEDGAHKTIAALVEFCRNYAFGGRAEKKDPTPRPQQPSGTAPPTSSST
ncbi:MAG: gene transfer agent family protein [Kiloniellaceae bacterium]